MILESPQAWRVDSDSQVSPWSMFPLFPCTENDSHLFSQVEYDMGGLMCTSASVCMCIATLADMVTLKGPYFCAGRGVEIRLQIDRVMRRASSAHKKVLGTLGLMNGVNSMLSSSQFLSRWGVDLSKLGYATAELVVLPRSQKVLLSLTLEPISFAFLNHVCA